MSIEFTTLGTDQIPPDVVVITGHGVDCGLAYSFDNG